MAVGQRKLPDERRRHRQTEGALLREPARTQICRRARIRSLANSHRADLTDNVVKPDAGLKIDDEARCDHDVLDRIQA